MKKTVDKVMDWLAITKIRILNIIKEHKYISAVIGVFLMSAVIALIVRAATDETIHHTTVSVGTVSITTESDDGNKSIAPNFSNIIYSLTYKLGADDSICSNKDKDISYKLDELIIEASIPLNDNIKWLGGDETTSSTIKTVDNNSVLTVIIPQDNVCSNHTRALTLSVLNAEKDTEIKPVIKIKAGSEGKYSGEITVDTVKTTYDDNKKIELSPKVVSGSAKKVNGGRDAMFGILLGFKSDVSNSSNVLKNSYLTTSADLILTATQGSNNESITLYTANTKKYNGDHDGNYYGINASSRHFFTSGNMPDLTSTSGKINGLTLVDAKDAKEDVITTTYEAPVVTLTGDDNIVIEKYPGKGMYYRTENNGITTPSVNVTGEIEEEIYDKNTKKIIGDSNFSLAEVGEYEVRYVVKGENSKTTMLANVSVVENNSAYSLQGAKTIYVKKGTSTDNFKVLGLYNSAGIVSSDNYEIEYLKDGVTVGVAEMLNNNGEYTQRYTITATKETKERTIVVDNELPSNTSDAVKVTSGSVYSGEEFTDHSVTINNVTATCSGKCTKSKNEEDGSYTYKIEKDNFIIEITKPVNIISKQYKLSISNLTTNYDTTLIDDDFYAIGAYYVTAFSPRDDGYTDDISVSLTAKLGNFSDSNQLINQNNATGVNTSSVSNKLYVTENSEYVEVTSEKEENSVALTGNYFTASMGEDVLLTSTFEYGYDADESIEELTVTIPVNSNLTPIAYSSEISSDSSSYFGYEISYNGQKLNGVPGYDIKYKLSDGTSISPEEFNSTNHIVTSIIINIAKSTSNSTDDESDASDNSFEILPGTVITLKTKYRVNTFTEQQIGNANTLSFNFGETIFSWGEITKTAEATKTVYITPYKVRTIIGVGEESDYNLSDNIILDASKNENYTVYATTDVISPAMNINSNVFGYNRISSIPVVFELPAGVNYVYNKNYTLEPSISYNNGSTILTYTYNSVEPNSWIEPIYFDFNVDVSAVTGNFVIKVSTGDINSNNYNITNDVSSIDKYKITNKNITIVNVEKVSYGQYVYDKDGKYISNIDKEDSFTFSTKLYNNVDETITNLNVYTVLPYVDTENESSFSGTYEIEGLPESALCTDDNASMVTKSDQVDQVNWQPCSNFKKSNNRYSGFTAFKIIYDSLAAKTKAENNITIHTVGNQPDDVYTFKSFLQYQDSGYISFIDVDLEVISKKITGIVWEDFNVDGIMDTDEDRISNITLKLYDSSDQLLQTTTPNEDGRYTFSGILTGDYYVMAEFNTDKYGVTGFPSEDFYDQTRLSAFKAVEITEEEAKKYNIFPIEEESSDTTESSSTEEKNEDTENSETGKDSSEEEKEESDEEEQEAEPIVIVRTDVISIGSETRIVRNINLGLSLRKIFGIEINKYITRAEVTNALGVVTTKEYGNTKLAKLDVKDINNLHIKVVYTLEIENVKYYPGYATLITEIVPDGMSFNSEYLENQGWELQEDGTLANRTLADEIISEGEKKYLTIAFDITRKEAGSFVNFASADELQILGGISDE